MRAWLLIGLLLGSGCLSPGNETAQDVEGGGFIFLNGHVWTGDGAAADAVAVLENRIVFVGDTAGAWKALPGASVINANGGLIMPGFHDSHNHVLEVMMTADPANGDPYATWAPGWDPVEGTLAQQQTALGHIQVWAQHNQDRMGDGDAPAPPHRHGMTDVGAWPENAAPDPAILQYALDASLRWGVTSHVEAGIPLAQLTELQALDGAVDLPVRFNLYLFPEDLDDALLQGVSTGTGSDKVRINGLKIYSDGWLGPRTAALRELYNDRPHEGIMFYTQEELNTITVRAHQGGLKMTAHTIGDRATAMMLQAYENANVAPCEGHRTCDDPRFTLEHVQLVAPDLMDRMVALDLIPSIQSGFATSDAPWAESALGDRIVDAYPWRTMVDRNLTITASSDFPIEVLPPLWGVERLVTRIDLNDQPAGGFMPEQALTLDEALAAMTINAAYSQFRDHELGTLTAGKLADIVVIDRDLFATPASEIADANVVLTMVDGRVVYQA